MEGGWRGTAILLSAGLPLGPLALIRKIIILPSGKDDLSGQQLFKKHNTGVLKIILATWNILAV